MFKIDITDERKTQIPMSIKNGNKNNKLYKNNN